MDSKEFEKQIPHLRSLMVGVGREFFGNRDDAEDVAQDALERLWRYCQRLDAQRNLDALTVMVAKNICVEKYKRRQREVMMDFRSKDGTSIEPLSSPNYNADAELQAAETAQRIDTALKTLAPREEQLVRKRHLEDKSTDEIAHETGLPKNSIKSMLSMAKAKLKKRLRQ